MTEVDCRTEAFVSWLTQQGLQGTPQEDLLRGYCQRLLDLGVPLMRFHLAQRAFHPRFGGIGFNWTRDEGLSYEHYEYRETPRQEWLRSPFYYLLDKDMDEFRSHLHEHARIRFPLLQELKDRGATEYIAAGLRFSPDSDGPIDPNHPSEGVLLSWTTDRTGGFSETDICLFRTLMPHLGLALKSSSNRQMATDLLQVYLGRDVGKRVMSGEIQRGSSREIDAVICYFDLKGFTGLAEQLPGPDLIDMLNDYFAIAVSTIQQHGGNILKFMGDGILTMFDLGHIRDDARAALDAANSLQGRMQKRTAERMAEGLPVADFTLALHAGQILYGNIGAENRLDFTVIGPTVNLTSRISGLHRSVGQNIILSEDVRVAAEATPHDLVSLGRYMLRGVTQPIELFTIYSPEA